MSERRWDSFVRPFSGEIKVETNECTNFIRSQVKDNRNWSHFLSEISFFPLNKGRVLNSSLAANVDKHLHSQKHGFIFNKCATGLYFHNVRGN